MPLAETAGLVEKAYQHCSIAQDCPGIQADPPEISACPPAIQEFHYLIVDFVFAIGIRQKEQNTNNCPECVTVRWISVWKTLIEPTGG